MHKRFINAGKKIAETDVENTLKFVKNSILFAERSKGALAILKKVETIYKMIDSSASISYGVDLEKIRVNLQGVQKTQEYLTLLKFEGYNFSHQKEWPEYNNIELHGTLEGIPVSLNLWLYGETNNCRRVQVGTQETPVYEIQCEDGSSLEEIFQQETPED